MLKTLCIATLFLMSVLPGFCSPPTPSAGEADSSKALIQAIRGQNSASAAILIRKGANVNAVAEDGCSALMQAASRGMTSTVTLLLKKGARVNHRDHNHETALVSALDTDAKYVKLEIVQALLRAGADARARSSYKSRTLPMLILNTSEDARANTPRKTLLRLVFEHGADPEAHDADGKTALMCAAEAGDADILDAVLERGINVNAADKDGKTALLYAYRMEIARKLLDRGALPNVHDEKRETPLMKAASGYWYVDSQGCSYSILMELLKRGAQVNAKNNRGETALFHALAGEDDAITDALIKAGADIHARDKQGVTLLMTAAQNGNEKYVRFLLDKGADVNERDNLGETALMRLGGKRLNFFEARRRSDASLVNILRMLTARGADIRARDSQGRNLLLAAAEEPYPVRFHQLIRAIDALAEKGAEVDARNREGESVLILAARHGELRSQAGSDEISLDRLLVLGANAGARDRNGFSALTWAAFHANDGHIALLRAKGADPDLLEATMLGDKSAFLKLLPSERNLNRRAPEGETALTIAAQKGDVEIVRALLERGADPNAANEMRFTPLHFAAGAGGGNFARNWDYERADAEALRLEIARALLARGANINALSKSYKIVIDVFPNPVVPERTPLEWAIERQSLPMMKLLLEHGASLKGAIGVRAMKLAQEAGRDDIIALLKKSQTGR